MTDPSPTLIYATCLILVLAVAWWMKGKSK